MAKKKDPLKYLTPGEIDYTNSYLLSQEDIDREEYASASSNLKKDYSKYEPYLEKGTINKIQPQNWDDARARAQSGTEKVLNSVGQGFGTFGTALASTVASLGSGAVAIGAEIATGGEAKGMDIFLNNPVMKGINDFDKFLKEDLMPTYYTKEQQEKVFSAALGTDLLNGVGFMMSAMVPAGAIGKVFGNMSKMASVAKAGKLGAVLEAAEAAGKITKAESFILSKTAKYLDKAGPIVGGAVGRIGESAMEASQTYTQIKESLTAERDQARQDMEIYGKTDKPELLALTDEAIEEKAKTGRNNVFGGNMALAVSDIAQYSRWFRGSGIGERLAKDGFKTVVKDRTKKAVMWDLLKESGQEAAEEGFQFLLSKGAEKQARYGRGFLAGLEDASGDLFTSTEGLKSMLLGAVLGGGMSAIAGAKNTAKLKEELNNLAAMQTASGDTTKRYVTDPVTGKKVINPELSKIATTFAHYEQQKEKAAAAGDKDAYDLAEKMQFSSLVESKIAAGQFDDFVDQLKDMGMSSTEEIEEMFGELPTKDGKKMTPAEVAFDKIQFANRIKDINEGLGRLPAMEKLGSAGISIAKYLLLTQESLRNQLKEKDEAIARVEAKKVYNPAPVGQLDLFAKEEDFLPGDAIKLEELKKDRELLYSGYKKVSTQFKDLIQDPEKANTEAEKKQNDTIKKAVDDHVADLKKEAQAAAEAVGKTIVVEDANGNKIEVVVGENEEGNFIDTETNQIIADDIVLKNTTEPIVEIPKEEEPESTDPVITTDENKEDVAIDEYHKKTTVNATTGQALIIEGGDAIVIEGERAQNPDFIEQTKMFNDPTISNVVVEGDNDVPKVITFKAELGTITEKQLFDTNARRAYDGLAPLTMEQMENDSDYVPIILTLMVDGVAKNTVKNNYHNPEYYFKTAEANRIDIDPTRSEAQKKAAHAANYNRDKATRANLVQKLKDNKSVVLQTASKSRGVLNYNPKVENQARKTSSVIGILANNFKELLNGVKNKYFSIENGVKNPINTTGLKIVTNVEALPKGTGYKITVQSNSSVTTFNSKYGYDVGTMLFDIVGPNGEVVNTSPFTKNRFSESQIKDLTELILEKLNGKNTVDVNGSLLTIAGTETIPGILDSIMYVGAVKSNDPDAIASQLYFTKDGRLKLGNAKDAQGKPIFYDASTPGIYDIVKKHLDNYKAKPHFKFKSVEIFGNSFGIPTKQGNGTFKIEEPTNYMEFLFGGKAPLITTALNPTKFVNSYFTFAKDNENNLLIEGQEIKPEPVVNKKTVNLLSTPSSEIIEKLNKLNTIEEKLNWLKDNELLSPININGKEFNVIDYQDRIMVLMKIGKYNIPFYISTGQAGKKTVKAGNWYAIFGIGEKGWINKGSEAEINSQYGWPVFEKLAKILNEGVGTIENREDAGNDKIKKLDSTKESINAFNANMNLTTTPAADPSKANEFYVHVVTTMQNLNDELINVQNAEKAITPEPVAPIITPEPVSNVEAKKAELQSKIIELQDRLDTDKYKKEKQDILNSLAKGFLPDGFRFGDSPIFIEKYNPQEKKWEDVNKDILSKDKNNIKAINIYFNQEGFGEKLLNIKNQYKEQIKSFEDLEEQEDEKIEKEQTKLLSSKEGILIRKDWSLGKGEGYGDGVDGITELDKVDENGNAFLAVYYYTGENDKWIGDSYFLGKTKQEVEDKINAKYDAELKALEGNPEVVDNKVEIEKLEKEIENLEQNKEQALSEKFKGIDISQKTIDIISEREDKKAIAFIEKYDAFNYEYDSKIEQLKEKVLDLKSKAKEVVEEKEAPKEPTVSEDVVNSVVTQRENECANPDAVINGANNYPWDKGE